MTSVVPVLLLQRIEGADFRVLRAFGIMAFLCGCRQQLRASVPAMATAPGPIPTPSPMTLSPAVRRSFPTPRPNMSYAAAVRGGRVGAELTPATAAAIRGGNVGAEPTPTAAAASGSGVGTVPAPAADPAGKGGAPAPVPVSTQTGQEKVSAALSRKIGVMLEVLTFEDKCRLLGVAPLGSGLCVETAAGPGDLFS